ncbi:MAG TPA: hypothetical protein VGS20_07875 [Candidatus Acidoferrales bacterium]|nr:hypothetical protein [Candidatus Acidoferrales bacterium]
MPRPKPRWLKLDKLSTVRVRAGSTGIELRIIFPARRLRRQLEMLKPGND